MAITRHDFILKIRRYLGNLWGALIGRDPYRDERKQMDKHIEHLRYKVSSLNDLYYAVVEKWKESTETIRLMEQQTLELKKNVTSYQTLVETLRSTIRDKEAELAEQRHLFLEQMEKINEGRNNNKV